MLRLLRQPSTPLRFLVLGAVIGLAALSKVSGIALLAPAGLLLVWLAWQHRDFKLLLWSGVCVLAAALLVAAWWYIRNWQLYGDPLGLNVFVAIIGPRKPPITLWQLTKEWQGLVRSYWGVFGWMNVVAPNWYYWLLNGLALLGIGGLLVQVVQRLRWHRWPPPVALARMTLLVIWSLVVFISLVRWTLITPATQGRLLFPAAFALVLLLAYGLSSLVPQRWRGIPPGTTAVLLVGLAIWVPFVVIRPSYSPPRPLTAEEQNVIPNKLSVSFEQRFALVGYKIGATSVQPGKELVVTLYWKAQAREDKTLSAFVQLVDTAGDLVANRNVLLGSASFTTPYWIPGTVIQQTYVLQVSPQALNPSKVDIVVGLFQYQDIKHRLEAFDAAGAPLGDACVLGTVNVEAEPQGGIYNAVAYNLENQVALIGYNLENNIVSPGGTVHVTLFWVATMPITNSYATFVQVVDAGNVVWGQLYKHLPGSSDESVDRWPVGQIIQEDYSFTLASDTPAGIYAIYVGMYLPETATNLRIIREDGSPGDNHIVLNRILVEKR
jgi:hypothetical protein